jgi:hypothetical protein
VPTLTRTPTRTLRPTITPTASPTPTGTPTATATATPTCVNGLQWDLSEAIVVGQHVGGSVWLTKTVPTDFGWGVFWLYNDPAVTGKARLYYAHLDFTGQTTAGPMWLLDVARSPWRENYYNAAWNDGHFGLLIANQTTLNYYNLSLDGVLSGRRTVGPPLFVSSIYSSEADSDFDAFPGGFMGVIEGSCDGHSCSYAFRLNTDGTPAGSVYNLVDYDYTHAFYPATAFDGTGFAILMVKDILISGGGVGTKYISGTWSGPSTRTKVVPGKEYVWDEFPDIAWNGDHFGSVWTEVTQRPPSGQPPVSWQIHFASHRRTRSSATLIADKVVDVMPFKSGRQWITQIHAVGGQWVVQYARWQGAAAEPVAVWALLDDVGTVHAELTPYPLSLDALGSSVHGAEGQVGRMGLARGDLRDGVNTITFQLLDPPMCRP